MKALLGAVVIIGLTWLACAPTYAQEVFFEDWELSQEWMAGHLGEGNAAKGEVNGHVYGAHYNVEYGHFPINADRSTCHANNQRVGIWRAVSHSTLPGPPNEVWAWRRVEVLPGATYQLTFEYSGDGPAPNPNRTFAAMGVISGAPGLYTGANGTLGAGLPVGLVYEDLTDNVERGWSGNGQGGGWRSGSVTITTGPTHTNVYIWGVVQNLESEQYFCGLFVDCVRLTQVEAATPTPTVPACANDIDGDTVCDEQEVANVAITGNPQASNRILHDSDGDGLTDGEEDANKNGAQDAGETSTRAADSDGDGYEDGLEVLFLGTDPLDANDPGVPIVDADGDRLPASIDPDDTNRDVDGDRYDDLYDALVFRDLAAASDASRVPNLGDVNGDAEAGNLDSLVIQALFLNSIDHTNPVFQAGGAGYDGFRYSNPSRNGQAGNLDSLLIQAHFLGNLPTFPLRF